MDSQIIDNTKQLHGAHKDKIDYLPQKRFKYLPPTYFKWTLMAIILVNILIPNPEVIHTPLRFLGIFPISLGLTIMLWAHQIFQNQKTAIRPDDKPSKLITTGPFQYTRHPMYLGFVVIILGVGILLGSLLAILGTVVLFIILDRKFVSYEEQNLEKVFGEEYLNYRYVVRKWI